MVHVPMSHTCFTLALKHLYRHDFKAKVYTAVEHGPLYGMSIPSPSPKPKRLNPKSYKNPKPWLGARVYGLRVFERRGFPPEVPSSYALFFRFGFRCGVWSFGLRVESLRHQISGANDFWIQGAV